MKKTLKALAVLTLAACAFLLFGAWLGGLPRGTFIDGVDVGGLSRAAAVAAVRESKVRHLKSKELVICAGERLYSFTYPEFNFTDDLPGVVSSIRSGGSYFSHTRVYLNGAEKIVENICSGLERALVEPYARFNAEGEPFTYSDGCDGVAADRSALAADISRSLNGGFGRVTVRTFSKPRTLRAEEIRRRTSLLCRFATRFDSSNLPRSSNIALACSKINGTVLGAGQTFSFNRTVGERTTANGFMPAKIISGGRFVEGVGGGVCQVSTTLYNAAILSGLKIAEYHPHSLLVSYVAPSRDAMVSGSYFDLKLTNTRATPVYLRLSASGGEVVCSVYGEDDGVKRAFVSQVVETIPVPGDVVVEGEDERVLSHGHEGAVSLGYVVERRGEVSVKKLIRRDRYAPAPTVRSSPRAGTGQTVSLRVLQECLPVCHK